MYSYLITITYHHDYHLLMKSYRPNLLFNTQENWEIFEKDLPELSYKLKIHLLKYYIHTRGPNLNQRAVNRFNELFVKDFKEAKPTKTLRAAEKAAATLVYLKTELFGLEQKRSKTTYPIPKFFTTPELHFESRVRQFHPYLLEAQNLGIPGFTSCYVELNKASDTSLTNPNKVPVAQLPWEHDFPMKQDRQKSPPVFLPGPKERDFNKENLTKLVEPFFQPTGAQIPRRNKPIPAGPFREVLQRRNFGF